MMSPALGHDWMEEGMAREKRKEDED